MIFHGAYRMYETCSVVFQAAFFLLVLYRPEKVLNPDVLVSIGLLLCVTHSRVLIAKTCQKTMMEFSSPFSRVYLPWQNSPSVFDVTVWSRILSLGMPCSYRALLFPPITSRHFSGTACMPNTHCNTAISALANERSITTFDSWHALRFQTIFMVKFWKIH